MAKVAFNSLLRCCCALLGTPVNPCAGASLLRCYPQCATHRWVQSLRAPLLIFARATLGVHPIAVLVSVALHLDEQPLWNGSIWILVTLLLIDSLAVVTILVTFVAVLLCTLYAFLHILVTKVTLVTLVLALLLFADDFSAEVFKPVRVSVLERA